MTVVTESILHWINCSNDVWLRWFSSRENSFEEFLDVQNYLFNLFVLNPLVAENIEVSEALFYEKLRGVYRASIDEPRQFCVKQRAGNVFCSSNLISIQKGDSLRVKLIDPIGTMSGGIPYVELVYGKGYVLESLNCIDFILES
jgi:hypothetical protein